MESTQERLQFDPIDCGHVLIKVSIRHLSVRHINCNQFEASRTPFLEITRSRHHQILQMDLEALRPLVLVQEILALL
jgi:hypothetical protein